MADRDVAVRLSADVAGYIAGMEKAASSTKMLGATAKEAQVSGAKLGTATRKVGADASGAAAGIGAASRSSRELGGATRAVGQQAQQAAAGLAAQGAATRRMASSHGAAATSANTVAASMRGVQSASGIAASGVGRAGQAAASMGRSFMSSTVGIAGFAAAAIAPVKASMDLEAAMSMVKATGAVTSAQMDALKGSAMSMATSFGASGTQAMAGVEELTKAGVSASDILGGGLTGALSLAAAGSMDVGDAAESAASAMTQFGLSGNQVPHIADLFVQAANMAQGSAADISEALGNVGTVASQAGLSIEETVGFLGEMASYGITGAEAGTTLKSALISLENPSTKARKAMDQYGISLYDSNGKMKSLSQIAGTLQTAFHGVSDEQRNAAFSTIAGTYGLQAMNIMYKEGSKNVAQWTKDVSKSGAAQKAAGDQLDNLKGDLQRFQASWTNAFASIGNDNQSPLRGLVQDLTNLAGVVQRNQGTVVTLGKIGGAIVGMGVAAAGIAKVVGVFRTVSTVVKGAVSTVKLWGQAWENISTRGNVGLAPQFDATAGAANRSRLSFKQQAVAAGAVAVALTGATVAGRMISEQNEKVALTADQAKSAMEALSKGSSSQMSNVNHSFTGLAEGVDTIGDAVKYMSAGGFWHGLRDGFNQLAGGMLGIKTNSEGFTERLQTIDQQLASMKPADAQKAYAQLSKSFKDSGVSATDAATQFPAYKAQLESVAQSLGVSNLTAQQYADWMGGKVPPAIEAAATAQAHSKTATEGGTAAMEAQYTQAGQLAQALQDTAKALQDYADLQLKLSGSSVAANQAMADTAAAIAKNGKGLDLSTQKGRDNQKALDDLASSIRSYQQNLEASGSTSDEAASKTAKMADAWVKDAQAAGMSADQARLMAESLGLIPSNVKSEVLTTLKGATPQQVREFENSIKDLPASQQIQLRAIAQTQGLDAANAQLSDFMKKDGKSVTLNTHIKGATDKQVDDLQKKIDKLPKDKAVAVTTTANTKGYDDAIKQLQGFQKELHTLTGKTSAGVVVHASAKVNKDEFDKFVKDLGSLPKDKQTKIAAKADTNFPAAKKELEQFLASIPKDKEQKVQVHASLVDPNGVNQQLKDIDVTRRSIDGKPCLVPVDDPGAVGTKARIDGINYVVKDMNGVKVLVPTSAPGAPQAQGALMGVAGAADLANGKHVTIPSSTPGTAASTGLLKGLRSAWDRIVGKSVRVPSSAPGASAAAGQIMALRAQANATNGKHVSVTASASTGAARSALRALEAPLHTTLNVHVNMPHISAPTVTANVKIPKLAGGGSVPGSSPSPTADNVPIWATAGEFMHPVSAVRKYGPGFMEAVRTGRFPVERARGYAGGGSIGGQYLASGGSVTGGTARTIIVQMGAAGGAFADLSKALAAQTAAQKAANKAMATWRRSSGKNRQKAADAASKANDNLKTASDAAAQAIQSFSQAASQAAQQFSQDYRKGGSVSDLIADMQGGTNTLALFEAQLSKLRSMGLSQSAIDSLTGMGVNQGSALAGEIVSGGKSMVDKLNLATYRLDQIADKLGRTSLAKFGSGGTVTRPTLALVGEAGAETMVPHSGPTAIPLWYEAGRAIGALPASSSPYNGPSGGGSGTLVVQAPDVQLTALVDLGDLGGVVEGKVVQLQTRTARNVARSRR